MVSAAVVNAGQTYHTRTCAFEHNREMRAISSKRMVGALNSKRVAPREQMCCTGGLISVFKSAMGMWGWLGR